ncbi:hypothetical protein Egran_05833 [Elaphomyces granulatus]|uniref:AAA+ ATPase domain-containing protein n=1 Tax=Elaphomyces granulatus TaxID=519963 RepID=A0A232LQW6_9EURO|nr:hypothetical protein Egran_05833 [Elaphomyces granulatus]
MRAQKCGLAAEEADNTDPPSFTEDLEALHLQRLEIARENREKGIVIQHRSWKLSDIFQSDDDIRPVTPSKSRLVQEPGRYSLLELDTLTFTTPPTPKMPFISSPVLPSSPPPIEIHKRRLEDSSPSQSKRQKTIGGFIADDDDEDDLNALNALRDVELQNESALSDHIAERQSQGVSTKISLSRHLLSRNDSFEVSRANIPQQNLSLSPQTKEAFFVKSSSGRTHRVEMRKVSPPISYERLIAGRSLAFAGRAQRSYYGIEIHKLLDEAARETKKDAALRASRNASLHTSIETPQLDCHDKKAKNLMWTEKYRASDYTDLLGDERTHRSVLHWLKGWESIVFPGLSKSKRHSLAKMDSEQSHRKILLLAGAPGLGKTTLAHVCARKAGYEVLEINASDDRSRDVVKGRIRDSLSTENVRSITFNAAGKDVGKTSRPICVIVDEADGVVSGSGAGGEGGFIKALVDLVLLDQRNSAKPTEAGAWNGQKKKGDAFQLLRPLILICNDIYHPSLRPLRTSAVAEIIHVRHVPLDNVVQRVKIILKKEGIPYDNNGVRKLCEVSWGLNSRRETGSKCRGIGEGDIRSVLVAAEWIARKLKPTGSSTPSTLTKCWLEENILNESSQVCGSSRGFGRGVREIVERVFTDGAGFPEAPVGSGSFEDNPQTENWRTPAGLANLRKRHAISQMREMIDTSGEYDRCITDCFTLYPTQAYQDDMFLSKPNMAYDWLHFHDAMSSRIYKNQDWELYPYLSQSALAFHDLFASAGKRSGMYEQNEVDNENDNEHPFSGPRADFAAYEAQKQNHSILLSFQSSFSAPLTRLFRSLDCVVIDLMPNLVKMISPNVKPIEVRGGGPQSVVSLRKDSERALVRSAVKIMSGLNMRFERSVARTDGRIIYQIEPPLDELIAFSRMKCSPIDHSVRQILDQEYRKESVQKQSESSQFKFMKPGSQSGEKTANDENIVGKKYTPGNSGIKRDFFGRIINQATEPARKAGETQRKPASRKSERSVWVTFHEGFSNAVRKPISMSELLADL